MNNNYTLERDNMKIEFINPVDKRILTQQGEEILLKEIHNEDYSTEVINTSYDEWEAEISKVTRLVIEDTGSHCTYIIPTGIAGWTEGRAFVTCSEPTETTSENTSQPVTVKYNKIQFNNFKLSDFLNEDNKYVIDYVLEKRKVKYALKYSGSGVTFHILINDKQIVFSDNTTKNNSVWGDGNSFSMSIPINKYLTYGKNTIKTTLVERLSNNVSLHAVLLDTNKQSGVFEEGNVDLDTGSTNILEFNVPEDFELVHQMSIFDDF
jgi:hypothetical protein